MREMRTGGRPRAEDGPACVRAWKYLGGGQVEVGDVALDEGRQLQQRLDRLALPM
jgi:hypothetical protein